MSIITKQDLMLASKQRKMHIVRDFPVKHHSWSDVNSMYELDDNVIYNGFGAFQLQDMKVISKSYKDLLDSIYKIHNGRPVFAMTIVHLVSRNSNIVSDSDFLTLRNKVYEESPKKMPEGMIVKDYGLDDASTLGWSPNIHRDAEERFYLQGSGQTLWRLFDDSKTLTDSIIVNPGDLAYIPKGIHHSVESIGPRHSISIALSDDPEILQA